MLLNRIEKALMNNAARAAIQRRFEVPRLLAMGGPINGGRALEIGCGRGVGVEAILDEFCAGQVDAFDLDPKMVALAERRLASRGTAVRLWVGDAESISSPDGAYDAVFDFAIIHHVPRWRNAVREVRRVLRPGGLFDAEEVLARFILHPLTRRLLDHPLDDRFDHQGFVRALEDHAFELIASRDLAQPGCARVAAVANTSACSQSRRLSRSWSPRSTRFGRRCSLPTRAWRRSSQPSRRRVGSISLRSYSRCRRRACPPKSTRGSRRRSARRSATYAATECTFLSHGCKEDWLHVNSDWVMLEPVDDRYQPVEPGVQSHTGLITNLANRVQPMIRYDLGDSVLARADACPCGNPLPAIRVQGRAADVLTLDGPRGGRVSIAPLAFGTALDRIAGLDQFQVEQADPLLLLVRLRHAASADPEHVWQKARSAIAALLSARGLDRVIVERADEAPTQGVGGKYRQVIPYAKKKQ